MLEDDFSGLSKLESILREKNIEIERLRSLLQTEMKHKLEYEKIKNLLQWQVFDKPRGVAQQTLIRGFPNGETHSVEDGVSSPESIG